MRIAIYGDSYAERRWHSKSGAWWRVLESYGYNVKCFADSSSSFIWSARLLDQHADKFDLNIWCTTSVARTSVKLNDDSWLHLSVGASADNLRLKETAPEKLDKLSAFEQYIKHLYDVKNDDLIFECLTKYFLGKYNNLMVIPGFYIPNVTRFSLSDVSQMEESILFPEYKNARWKIHERYQDMRICHMSRENNKILAKLVNDRLGHGLFQTDLNNFVPPTGTIEESFKKKSQYPEEIS